MIANDMSIVLCLTNPNIAHICDVCEMSSLCTTSIRLSQKNIVVCSNETQKAKPNMIRG